MKTFILRARHAPTEAHKWPSHLGQEGHVEIIAHTLMNAFFAANDFRSEVECLIILESTETLPLTLSFKGAEGLSFDGFHENAFYSLIIDGLKQAKHLKKDSVLRVQPGFSIQAQGFEKRLQGLIAEGRSLYWLDPKGVGIATEPLEADPVFILTDHLGLPKKNLKLLQKQGVKSLSLGKKMLFASQCVTLIHHYLDSL